MLEPRAAVVWAIATLRGDPELADPSDGIIGGYHDIAPAGAKSPYAIVRALPVGEDLTGLDNGLLIWVPVTVQIMICDRLRGDYALISSLSERVYTLLHGKDAVIDGAEITGCNRLFVRPNNDVVGDAVERYVEQQFNMQVRSTST